MKHILGSKALLKITDVGVKLQSDTLDCDKIAGYAAEMLIAAQELKQHKAAQVIPVPIGVFERELFAVINMIELPHKNEEEYRKDKLEAILRLRKSIAELVTFIHSNDNMPPNELLE